MERLTTKLMTRGNAAKLPDGRPRNRYRIEDVPGAATAMMKEADFEAAMDEVTRPLAGLHPPGIVFIAGGDGQKKEAFFESLRISFGDSMLATHYEAALGVNLGGSYAAISEAVIVRGASLSSSGRKRLRNQRAVVASLAPGFELSVPKLRKLAERNKGATVFALVDESPDLRGLDDKTLGRISTMSWARVEDGMIGMLHYAVKHATSIFNTAADFAKDETARGNRPDKSKMH